MQINIVTKDDDPTKVVQIGAYHEVVGTSVNVNKVFPPDNLPTPGEALILVQDLFAKALGGISS